MPLVFKIDPNELQAWATVALIAVTAWYVILTSRLVHAGSRAHLRPVHLQSISTTQWLLFLHNDGPGVAVEVHVGGYVLSERQPPGRTEFRRFHGATAIRPDTGTDYGSPTVITATEPFRLKWRTATGKKTVRWWTVHHDSGSLLEWNRISRIRAKGIVLQRGYELRKAYRRDRRAARRAGN